MDMRKSTTAVEIAQQAGDYSHLPGTLADAIEARLEIGDKNMNELFDFLAENEGLSMYAIAKKIGWSVGKVSYTIGKLEELGVIKKVAIVEDNVCKLLVFTKEWKDMLPEESLKELEELIGGIEKEA